MIAVVTGGSGFIGRHLVRRLLEDGHEVRCLVRPEGRFVENGARRYPIRYDDPQSLLSCDALGGADVIFHLAAATRAVSGRALHEANVTPARNLLGAIASRRLVPRFIYVSSQAAAGPATSRDRAVTEEDAPHPVEEYGRSKLAAERVVEGFGERMPVTIVRPCAVFGPHDRDFAALFLLGARGVAVYPGTASHWLSLLHVDDVVSGVLAAASDVAAGRTYFLSSTQPVQWRELGRLIGDAAGKPPLEVNLPSAVVRVAALVGDAWGAVTGVMPLASSEKAVFARYPFWICSAARARNELGFREVRSLPEAVRDTYLWYRQSGKTGGSPRSATAVA